MEFDLEKLAGRIKESGFHKYVLLAVLIAIPALLVTRFFVTGFLAALSIVTSWASGRFDFRWTGIEFTTFTTVLIGISFGPLIGGVAGLFLILGQMAAGSYIGPYILWVIPTYAAIGALAGTIGAGNIAMMGVVITLGIHVIFAVFTLALTPEGLSRYAPYAVGNTLFNIVLFQYVASRVLPLM